MSYINEYERRDLNEKIPYDDIPISRRQNTGGRVRQTSTSFNAPSIKVLASVIAVLVIVNLALIITTFYYLRNSVVKEVNYYNNNITSVGDTSIMAGATADLCSVAVAAGGGNLTTEYDFIHRASSKGSGVILDITSSTIYILTCYHVVDGRENNVYVMPITSVKPIKVSVVGYSSRYDIAVLKVNKSDEFDGCTKIQVFDSTYLSRGETCFAVGNSLGYGQSVTQGVVSRTNITITTDGSYYPIRVLQHSTEINPGNSGGGLFNNEGKFIGLVNAKLHSEKQSTGSITVAGMAYAIPSTFAVNVAKSIIANNGSPTCVNLGIDFAYNVDYGVSVDYIEYDGKTSVVLNYTVQVSSIESGSIASGKLMVGDFIESFTYTGRDGEKHEIEMFNAYSFEDICFDVMPNSQIVFKINRLSSDRTVSITASSFSTY